MTQPTPKSGTRRVAQRAGSAQIAAYVHSLSARHGALRAKAVAERSVSGTPLAGAAPAG